MRVLLQRVSEAQVEVDSAIVGAIGSGLLLLAAFEDVDSAADLDWMAAKIIKLRIFSDNQGIMNLSILDHGGDILAISQFTLFGDCAKGNRPSWSRAAKGDISRPLFDLFIAKLSALLQKPIETGIFGAEMRVQLVNDGPVTLMLDSRKWTDL